MRMYIKYSNQPHFSYFDPREEKGVPYELRIQDEGSPASRKRSLKAYVKSIEYLFQGVSNYASGKIVGFTIQNNLGAVTKSNDVNKWQARFTKEYAVVYGVSRLEVSEGMYLADSIYMDGSKGKPELKPMWVSNLVNPSSDLLRRNLMAAITYGNKCGKGYGLMFADDALRAVDPSGNPIAISDIEDQEVFLLFQLIERVAHKGLHVGIYLIDAEGMSDEFLRVLVDLVHSSLISSEDSYIFIYNAPKSITVRTNPITLPNFELS